jgi:photosystem II stability/assembly factor-like uncharacterized protein
VNTPLGRSKTKEEKGVKKSFWTNFWKRPITIVAAVLVIVGLFVPSALGVGHARASISGAFQAKMRAMPDDQESSPGDPRLKRGREGDIRSMEQQLYQERAYPAKTIPAGAYSNGVAQYNFVSDLSGSLAWQELGPIHAPAANFPDPYNLNATAVSGRLTALAVVPSTCSTGSCGTMYAGTANGGVWKTTNAGQSWVSLLDHQVNESVGAVALDPVNPNIVYVGLGEPNYSVDSNRGTGILRSTDGGQTWTRLGYNQFVNEAIANIIVDPRGAGNVNTTKLYVVSASAILGGSTTASDNFAPGAPNTGFFYSSDGGSTWTPSNPTTFTINGNPVDLSSADAQSLAMDPSNPNVLYAGFTYAGIFKSTDDGQTWTWLGNGAPTYTDGIDRITIAVVPSNPQVIYAAADIGFSKEAMYKSTDAGADWSTLTSAPDACNQQCWYDMPLAVDPNNANIVYAGGESSYAGYVFNGFNGTCGTLSPLAASCDAAMMKTTDGGTTWSDIGESASAPGNGTGPVHPDDHTILINPADSNTVYTGTDGGLFVTANAGATWSDLNNGIASVQFQGIAVGPTGSIFGGTQDNGTFRLDPGANGTAVHVNNGDGGEPVTDPTDPNTAYYSFFGSTMLRDDNALGPNLYPGTPAIPHYFPVLFISPWQNDNGQFYQPRAIDPSEPNVIFAGTDRILRSTNKGGTDGNGDTTVGNDPSDSGTTANPNWEPLSAEPTYDKHGNQTSTGTFDGHNISAIAVSSVDPNVMAIATTHGHIYYTTNALAPVTWSGDCNSSAHKGVFQCQYTGGITWTEIDGAPLPNRYATALRFAPGSSTTLYVTYSGFSSVTPNTPGHLFTGTVSTNGATWTEIDGSGPHTTLPDLPFNDIVINPTNGHLYAAADFGVFFSANNGHTWVRKDHGLANSPVFQMQYDASNNTLVAATHGRGIWSAPAP